MPHRLLPNLPATNLHSRRLSLNILDVCVCAGRSHNKSFVLFRLGTRASSGVKTFAETGRTDVLEEQTQGEGGVYDEFNAPPISTGAGRTEAEFFVDGNHSRV
jgi:hypothetical protein